MGNKHRKLFVIIGNEKGANLCQKCTEIRLAAGLRPDFLGKLMRYFLGEGGKVREGRGGA